VGAVHVGIRHDDDAVVTRLVGVEVVADAAADGGDERGDGVARERAVQTGALHVEDLAAQGQDGLVLTVARLLGRAACGVALYNEDFGLARVLGGAVRQLARQAEAVEHVLAARGLAGLASGLAGLERLTRLADDALGGGWVLFQVLGEALGDGGLHEAADLGVAELGLGLALELRLVQLHADDGRQALAAVVAAQVGVLLLEDVLGAGVIVDGARHRLLEAVEVGAALVRVDVVGERQHAVAAIGTGPLHGNFHRAVLVLGLEVDGLVERLLAVVEVLHEVDDAAIVLEGHGARLLGHLAHERARVAALVGELDLEPLVEERHLAEAVLQRREIVDARIGEDLRIRPERDGRAGLAGASYLVQLVHGLAALEADLVFLAVAAHVHDHPGGKRVYDRDADAMEAAGHLVATIAELAAGMEDGKDHLDGGHLLGLVALDGDAAAVVDDLDGVIGPDKDLDVIAEAGKCLVHGIVHHLVYQMMESERAGRADVHAGAFADCLESLQDLDGVCTVVLLFGSVCHMLSFMLRLRQRGVRAGSLPCFWSVYSSIPLIVHNLKEFTIYRVRNSRPHNMFNFGF